MTDKELDYMFLPINADKDLVREIEEIQSYLTEKVAESEIKAQAVKEFADKLKEKLKNFIEDNEDYDGKVKSGLIYIDVIGLIGNNGEIISLGIIDELLKEYEK